MLPVEQKASTDEAPALEEEQKNPSKGKTFKEKELDNLEEYYQGDPFNSPGF